MTTTVDDLVAKRLRQRRRSLDLTLQQVGSIVGVRFQQIHKYECGTNSISAARLWQLARALQVPVEFFFEGCP
jgi:transcriptional regulator with XRE-family HTH domain